MISPTASAQVGGELTVAVRAFIGTRSVQAALGLVKSALKSRLYLRHPDMQPKVRELMALRAHPASSASLKAIVFLARIRTR